MAKKCTNCNKVYGDEVLYCPECGKKLEEQRAMQNTTQRQVASSGSFDFQALLHTLLYDYGLILAAVLGFAFTWFWDCIVGLIVSGAILVSLHFEKEKTQNFKAIGVAKVMAIINVILSVVILFM